MAARPNGRNEDSHCRAGIMLAVMEVGAKGSGRNSDLGNDGITPLVDHDRAMRAREVMRPMLLTANTRRPRTLQERAAGKPAPAPDTAQTETASTPPQPAPPRQQLRGKVHV
jgi:hypothetical protein